MKLNYNQIINYIRIRNYIKTQCAKQDELNTFDVKAHLRGKDKKEYLILTFYPEVDGGFALINSKSRFYSIKELIDTDATIVINSPEVKTNIEFKY